MYENDYLAIHTHRTYTLRPTRSTIVNSNGTTNTLLPRGSPLLLPLSLPLHVILRRLWGRRTCRPLEACPTHDAAVDVRALRQGRRHLTRKDPSDGLHRLLLLYVKPHHRRGGGGAQLPANGLDEGEGRCDRWPPLICTFLSSTHVSIYDTAAPISETSLVASARVAELIFHQLQP